MASTDAQTPKPNRGIECPELSWTADVRDSAMILVWGPKVLLKE